MFRLVFLLFACMTFCFGADDFSSFRPDLSTSDPYLRYLRRIPLSGVWEGAVCFSRDAETIRAFRNRREHPMRKMLVPEAHRTEGNNFGLAVAAVYRRSFELRERKPGDRVLLILDDVVGEITVQINGREAGKNHYTYQRYL